MGFSKIKEKNVKIKEERRKERERDEEEKTLRIVEKGVTKGRERVEE